MTGPAASTTLRELDPARIQATIERLHRRVSERFPDASLAGVVGGLVETAKSSMGRAAQLRRPYLGIRSLAILLIVAFLFLLVEEVRRILSVSEGAELVQTVDAAVNTLVYVGVAVFFAVTFETRLKRSRVLEGLHQLRSVAHIIDMHQLDKDPKSVRAAATSSSPQRHLSDPDLARYYDYCSEALSLVSKVAAVHAQHLNDSVVLGAVDEVEMLCTGLSRKIWQKIMLIPRAESALG